MVAIPIPILCTGSFDRHSAAVHSAGVASLMDSFREEVTTGGLTELVGFHEVP
jgi:hypothetical protein